MKTINSFSINKWKTIALLMLLIINTTIKAQFDDFVCLTEHEPLDSVAKLTANSSKSGNINR